MKLKKLILQLSEEDFNKLSSEFEQGKADKYNTLMCLVRQDKTSYHQVQQEMELNATALYTLKSRLFRKIQEYLLDNLEEPKLDLLKKVSNIPNLLYSTPRETTIAIMNKLETDLKKYDMPNELAELYAAFKMLNLHTEKHYEYSQLYNKHVAYTIALDKAQDLVADFHKKLGEYYATRDPLLLEVIPLLKKEMENVCRLYESHRLYIYQSIINVSCELFLPLEEHTRDDEAVEDVLQRCDEIISDYAGDMHYLYLGNVIIFLNFEYYHKLGLSKKEAEYFEELNDQLPLFLLYNFCAYSSKFLLSKVERYIELGTEGELYEENKVLGDELGSAVEDAPNYINCQTYLAISAYYAGHYKEAAHTLNELLNKISFIHYPHAEIEVKLLLAQCYAKETKYDLAWTILESIARKRRDLKKQTGMDYDNAAAFMQMMKAQMATDRKGLDKKLSKLKEKFHYHNQGEQRMLGFLKMDDAFAIVPR